MEKKRDCILRGLICGGEVALAVADTTSLVNEAIRIHNLSALSAAALGRTLTAAAYMCSAAPLRCPAEQFPLAMRPTRAAAYMCPAAPLICPTARLKIAQHMKAQALKCMPPAEKQPASA